MNVNFIDSSHSSLEFYNNNFFELRCEKFNLMKLNFWFDRKQTMSKDYLIIEKVIKLNYCIKLHSSSVMLVSNYYSILEQIVFNCTIFNEYSRIMKVLC